jgi:hypothetical protein
MILLSPMILIVAIGLASIKKQWLYTAAVIVLILASILSLSDWYTSNPKRNYTQKENWREITGYIVAEEKPGDAIIFFHPAAKLPFDFYINKMNAHENLPAVINYFPETETKLNIYNLPEDSSFGKLPDLDSNILSRLDGYSRVWLILTHTFDKTKTEQGNTLLSLLQERYEITEEKTYYIDTRIYLMTFKEIPGG